MFVIDDLIIAAAIAGTASAASSAYANNKSAKSTEKQMAFQDDMSSTAHQREVLDLKEAGLNPMLSAKLGGASTPQGASYEYKDVGTGAISAAKDVYRTGQEVKVMRAQEENLNASASQSRSTVFLNMAQADKASAEAQESRTRTGLAEAQQHALNLGLPNIPLTGDLLRSQAGQANASARQSMSQVAVNNELVHKIIQETGLTATQIEVAMQVIQKNLGDEEQGRILGSYFKTTPGRANVIGRYIKESMPDITEFLNSLKGKGPKNAPNHNQPGRGPHEPPPYR